MYINNKNEYPRYIGDIQLEHPNWKPGQDLPNGWTEVLEAPRPTIGTDQITFEDFPVEVDGVMTQNWQVRDMTAEEIERRDAPKRAREKLLALGLTEVEIDALVRGLR